VSDVVVEQAAADRYHVRGELTLETVPTLCRRPLFGEWARGSTVTVDLSGVTRSDSVGLALLIEWLRLARQRDVTLKLAGLPEQMREIARISDLLPILPLA